MNPVIQPLGDTALVLSVSATLEDQRRLWVMQRLLQQEFPAWWVVLGVGNLTVRFDPMIEAAAVIEHGIELAWQRSQRGLKVASHHHDVPVVYGGKAGPDLIRVAEHAGLTPKQVVERHAAGQYIVYCIGFLPGFPYLGGLDPQLATPRLDKPRLKVPAGAVGIGGAQTGIYPSASPGGWNLIGHTDLRLFDPAMIPPALLAPGDTLRFVPTEVRA
ncbi:KipI family sensor histidine kinase inhibitor [Silvimonas terrae]|uniref:KipI family sensor histidine kinase inhibitor n=1 Tax=Silvimonas terrae TaxID=300266 RepID=A0A840REJ2_9NEIS|nr:5-oxoprolinase subunit PxpB [Silvimonas terrae]MBB5191004.1 KipI family sensor histidine kinase inhibitor [Silvimonas terrae]